MSGYVDMIGNCTTMETPIGRLTIKENGTAITEVHLGQESEACGVETSLLIETKKQLQEYFEGKRKEFELPLYLQGTAFQQKVWEALRHIPYGETCTYGEIAAAIGNPKAARAIGGANHNNPVMIIVPCHRVIGADGSLTGFGGGLPAKEYLLSLESKCKSIS